MVNTDLLKQILPDNLKEECFVTNDVSYGIRWDSFITNILSIIRLCGTSNKRLLKFDNYNNTEKYKYIFTKRTITAHNDYYSVKIEDLGFETTNNPFRSVLLTFYRTNGNKFLQFETTLHCTYNDEKFPFHKFDFEDVRALLDNAYDSGIDYGSYVLVEYFTYPVTDKHIPVGIIKKQ
jgi:hypothetical protein